MKQFMKSLKTITATGETTEEPEWLLDKHKKLLKKLDKNHLSRFVKLKQIYKFVDEHNEEMFKEISVCKAGCSYCCYMPVDISEVEAVIWYRFSRVNCLYLMLLLCFLVEID